MLMYWDGSAHTIRKNRKAFNSEKLLTVPVKETGLEVNADKPKYRVTSRYHNAGRSYNVKFNNSSFEWGGTVQNLGKTLMIQNFIQEEIKSRLYSGNACYCSVQNLLSSSFLSEEIKMKVL